MLLLAAAFALPALSCGERGPRAIVLVVVDTLRPDRLSCYGYAEHRTPAIDALAARGVRFDGARAVASWTVPSMGAMLSSKYPRQLGLIERPVSEDTLLAWRDRRDQLRLTPAHSVRMLAEAMSERGLATAAFVNQPGLNVSDGFLQGFDEWYYPKSPEEIVRHDTRESLPYRPWAPSLTAAYEIDGRLVDTFGQWLEAHATDRTFAWVHLLTPHRPYNPVTAHAPRATDPSARYDAEIRATDELVQRLVTAIDRHVGLDRALVVFTSDHGEAFGEHGMEEHGHTLHGEVLRVPLVITGDGFPPGTTVDAPVRTIDVAPTLAHAAGAATTGMEGVDLRGWLAAGAEPLPVYAEGMLYGSTEHALLRNGWKLMTDTQVERPALYELARDPDELSDRSDEQPAHVESLRVELERRRARYHQDLHALDAEPTDTEDARRALRSLGYIQ